MINLILKLIVELRKFRETREKNQREYVETREKNQREYFDRYVQPAYDSAELIYKDYRALLRDLQTKVQDAQSLDPVINFLEGRRRELEPARGRLRALISQRIREGRATRFEAGILGLMSGVVTGVDRPYFQRHSYDETNAAIRPRPGRHTVLDIVQKLKERGSDDIDLIRPELLTAIDDKCSGIEESWQNLVRGYGELHAGTLPSTGITLQGITERSAGIAAIQSLLQEMHDMVDSGKLERQLPKDLERIVSETLPELNQSAQTLREIVHDLDNKEPNVTIADLEECLRTFEQELDSILQKES